MMDAGYVLFQCVPSLSECLLVSPAKLQVLLDHDVLLCQHLKLSVLKAKFSLQTERHKTLQSEGETSVTMEMYSHRPFNSVHLCKIMAKRLLSCSLQVEDNVTVVLLSEIVWDKFRPNTGCFEPLLLHFPDYSKGTIVLRRRARLPPHCVHNDDTHSADAV